MDRRSSERSKVSVDDQSQAVADRGESIGLGQTMELGRRQLLTAGSSLGLIAMAGTGHANGRPADKSAKRTATDQSAPTEVEDWNDLNAIREDLSADYVLVADLDDETAGYDDHVDSPDGGWEPLGDFSDRFYGTFDGNGHEISDLQIDRPETDRIGLFAYLVGTIESVTLTDVDVASGDGKVGGLVGESDEGQIVESSVSGRVTGTDSVGGIVGFSGGDIRMSSASVEVSGEGAVGGLVGYNGEEIRNASVSGDV